MNRTGTEVASSSLELTMAWPSWTHSQIVNALFKLDVTIGQMEVKGKEMWARKRFDRQPSDKVLKPDVESGRGPVS